MNNVPAFFARLSAGILAIAIMVCAVQADTVIQVNLNGAVDGIFGDQVSSYQIQLFNNEAPITVANFLSYANSSTNASNYNGSIFHRDVPGFIIQGGGFKENLDPTGQFVTSLDPIITSAPIQNEFSASRSNLRGTIAMAKLGNDPNSATSQWFINLGDNSSNLDNQNGGFTVFGQVAGEGMTLIDAAAALTIKNLNPIYYPSDPQNGPFTDVPIAYDEINDPLHKKPIFVTVLSMNVVSTVAWKGGASSASTDWGTLANWGSGTSVPNGAGVNLSIGSQASANNVIDLGSANRTVGNIYYTSGTGTTIQSTGGKSLILNNSGKTSLINVIGDHTISAPMILNNNTIVDIDGSMAISGAISGTGSLALNNTGSLTLTGSNSYTGKTLITNGMLKAGKAASLPGYNTSGEVTVSSGAALVVQAGTSTEWVESDISALQSNAVFNSGSYLAVDTSDGNFTYGSTMGGSQNFVKLGNNALLLTGNNTYSGNTIVVAGTLTAGKAASLPGYNAAGMITVYSGATLAVRAGAATGEWAAADIDTLLTNATFNSDSGDSYFGIDTTGGNFTYGSTLGGSLGFTKLGNNTLLLTGSNAYSGNTEVIAGTLTAGKAASLPGYDTGMVSVDQGATLAVRAGAATGEWAASEIDTLLNNATFNSGSFLGIDTTGGNFAYGSVIGGPQGLNKLGINTLTLTGINTFTGPTVINAGTLQLASGGTLPTTTAVSLTTSGAKLDANGISQTIASLSGVAGTEVMLGGSMLTTGGDNTSTTFAGAITSASGGSLTKTGSGTFTLSASPNYKGPTVISAGTLQLASGATLPSTTAVNLTASGAILDANGISQTIASLTGAAGTEVKRGGSTLTTGDNSSTTFAGAITSASGGSLTKTGSGTFTLTGSNTFSGAVNFNAGLINAAGLNNLGNGALNFNGGGLQFAAVFDPSSDNRAITFLAGGATLDTQANTITVSKGIFGNAGAGGLTKNGSGILELDGTVTYSGATSINAGVLKINNKQSTTLGAISGAGKLEVDGTSTVLTANSINVNTLTLGAGSVVVIAPISGGSHVGQELNIVPVPEPSALVLLGIGALAMLFAALKKR